MRCRRYARSSRPAASPPTGTILFFSMATVFNKAALGAECMAASATMVIGSGYTPDGGAYALDLLRRDERLVRALTDG